MINRRPRRGVPEINASSTADIAFLLLIFFLLTTSMDTDKGLPRRLPPLATDTVAEPLKLKERNALTVSLDAQDRLECAGSPVTLDELHDRAKLFIANPADTTSSSCNATGRRLTRLISPCKTSWWRRMPNCATSSPAGSGNAPTPPSATGRSRPSAWSSRKRLLKPN